jgi:hypothetical protein
MNFVGCFAESALIIVSIVIVLIIIGMVALYLLFQSYKANTVQNYSVALTQRCDQFPPIAYTAALPIGAFGGSYSFELAQPLLEISLAVTVSYCENLSPIPTPPGFASQMQIRSEDSRLRKRGLGKRMVCMLFGDPQFGRVVVAFAGTFYMDQWASDFDYPLVEASALNNYEIGIQCHKGFYQIYIAIRGKLHEAIRAVGFPISQLYITGHSLGGGLSTICAFDLAAFPGLAHVSFAAPRSGNIAFASKFNELLPNSVRVANVEDEIPHLPPAVFIGGNVYSHTGNLTHFDLNLGTIAANHVTAYLYHLPGGPGNPLSAHYAL